MYSNNDGNGIDKIRKVDLMVDENMIYKNGKSVQDNLKIIRTDFFLVKIYIFSINLRQKNYFSVVS